MRAHPLPPQPGSYNACVDLLVDASSLETLLRRRHPLSTTYLSLSLFPHLSCSMFLRPFIATDSASRRAYNLTAICNFTACVLVMQQQCDFNATTSN